MNPCSARPGAVIDHKRSTCRYECEAEYEKSTYALFRSAPIQERKRDSVMIITTFGLAVCICHPSRSNFHVEKPTPRHVWPLSGTCKEIYIYIYLHNLQPQIQYIFQVMWVNRQCIYIYTVNRGPVKLYAHFFLKEIRKQYGDLSNPRLKFQTVFPKKKTRPQKIRTCVRSENMLSDNIMTA